MKAGPLIIHPLFYHFPSIFYGRDFEHSQLQKSAECLYAFCMYADPTNKVHICDGHGAFCQTRAGDAVVRVHLFLNRSCITRPLVSIAFHMHRCRSATYSRSTCRNNYFPTHFLFSFVAPRIITLVAVSFRCTFVPRCKHIVYRADNSY